MVVFAWNTTTNINRVLSGLFRWNHDYEIIRKDVGRFGRQATIKAYERANRLHNSWDVPYIYQIWILVRSSITRKTDPDKGPLSRSL